MRYVFILIITLLFLTTVDFGPVVSAAPLGQSDSEVWNRPLNLSQSGAASEPRVVVDGDGVVHILWREDEIGSFYYTDMINGVGNQPTAVELPFATRRYSSDLAEDALTPLYDPFLIADSDNRILAFWTDSENTLYHSSVPASEITNYDSWSSRQQIAESVLGFDAVTDTNNNVHLNYLQSSDLPETPAGIYYRHTTEEDQIWSEAVMLYESAYFRTEEPENVNVQLAINPSVGRKASMFTAMDNRSLEEVLYTYSANRGETWQEPAVIDRRQPEDAHESVGPSQVNIIFVGGDHHLVWMAGHETDCQLYHQWSEDDGRTWQPATVVPAVDKDCPTDYRLLRGAEGLLFLLSSWEGGASLQAWNGEAWSEPVSQPILGNFVDPITQRIVGLDCQQSMVVADNRLLVVGCGLSGTNQDIWLLERPLGGENDWYSTTSIPWSEPTSLMTAEELLSDQVILSANDNRLHAFWILQEKTGAFSEGAKIYYSSWDENAWSRQVPLISLDMTQADRLTGVFDQNSGPFLLWRDKETNTYFSSSVLKDSILIPADWSIPRPIFETDALIGHVAPFLDLDGLVNIIYAKPLNEGRGIYIMRAMDDGKTWLDSIIVVDAVASNWEMVDRPSAAQTENGDIHVVFTVFSLDPEPVAKELYYTHSVNDGETWSDVQLIAQGDIGWSQVVGIGEQTVLVAWEQQDGEQVQLWSQQSIDGGDTWERPLLILDPSELPTAFSFTTYESDQPYMVQVQAELNGDLSLKERRWSNNAWQAIESYAFETTLKNDNLVELTAASIGNGSFMTIFNTEIDLQAEQSLVNGLAEVDATVSLPESKLLFTHRSVEMPGRSLSDDPALESAEVSAPAVEMPGSTASSDPATDGKEALDPAIAAAESPVPTSDRTDISDSVSFESGETDEIGESSSIVSSLITGVLPAVLIVVIVLAAGIIKLRPKR